MAKCIMVLQWAQDFRDEGDRIDVLRLDPRTLSIEKLGGK